MSLLARLTVGPGFKRAAARTIPVIALLPLSACAATDIVATQRKREPCGGSGDACQDADDAGPAASCKAQLCAPLASQTALCNSAGGVVQAGDHCDSDSEPQVSQFALCSCTDLVSGSVLSSDAFNGSLARPIQDASAIGVNRDVALSGSGSIDGELRVARRSELAPGVTSDALVRETAPCNCDESRLLDVETLVLNHKHTNDNASTGVSATALDGFRGAKELDLECGRYYFTRFKSEDPLTINAHGNVAIFIENNIELNESLSIRTTDAGRVSVFVAGEVSVGGALALGGDPNGSARVSLYLAGTGTLELRGSAEIVGDVYAPHAELVTVGTFQQYGSLFVRRAAPGGEMRLHYDTGAANPSQCEALP